jgi:hypothetical protein
MSARLLKPSNGARDKVHPEFRQGQCFFCLCRKEGAERSGVATGGSDVSFIEQIGGARTEPSRRFEALRRFDATLWLASSAAWRLDVISRADKRRDPLLFEAQRFTESLSAWFGECS